MQYITHNEDDLLTSEGTCGQGQITATYAQLVSTFGEPLKDGFDDYKCDAEWVVQFEDGSVATIYNWKNGINYCGSEQGIPTERIDKWNIGGRTTEALYFVKEAIKEVA